ncbi:MAG TPA: DMT family transporter [Acidimicrobiales bacterium]|nr:DMT family transporter [Acidimicrobiales bacterium]
MAVGAATCYGLTVVLNRSLARAGMSAPEVLSVRFAVATVGTFAIVRALGRPLRPVPGEWGRAVLLGIVGYAGQTAFFFSALQRGTAAAVTLVFYAYPAFVTLLEALFGWQPIDRRRVSALVLSAGGTALVVAGGSEVTISPAGALLAVGAAVAFGTYLLAGNRLLPRSDGLTSAAWVACGAALSWLTVAVVTGGRPEAGDHVPALVANGAATALAFGLMFLALRRIGAGRTAVAMTAEAASAVALAALFLGEGLRPLQAVGGVVILVAAVLVARSKAAPASVA